MIRLAATYTNTRHFDEASALADKVLAMPGAPESLRKIAQDEKQRAAKLKAGQK